MNETIYYDVIRDGIGVLPIVIVIFWAIGIVVGCIAFRRSIMKKGRTELLLIGLSFLILAGGLGIGNVYFQHYRCVSWLRSGEYEIAKGLVRNFQPKPHKGKGSEGFSVSGVAFVYSASNLNAGGFRKETGYSGGPLKTGVRVEVLYKKGRILRLSFPDGLPDN